MATELQTDKIQLSVVIDGTPARKELAELKQAAQKLGNEQDRLNKLIERETNLRKQFQGDKTSAQYKQAAASVTLLTEEYNKNAAALTANGTRQKELRDSIGTTGLSLNELRRKAADLRKTLAAGLLDNDAALENARALAEVEKRIQQVGTSAGRNQAIWNADRKAIDLNRMSVEQLTTGLKFLQDVQRNADPTSEAFKAASADIQLVTDRLEQLTNANRIAAEGWEVQRKSIALVDMSLEQLALEEQRLQAILNNPNTGEDDRIQTAKNIQVLRDRTKELTDVTGVAAREWVRMRESMTLDEMSVEQLKQEIEYLKGLRDALPGTGKAFDEAAAKVTAAEQKLKSLTNETDRTREAFLRIRGSLKLEDLSVDQLKLEVEELKRLRDALPPTSKEFAALDSKLVATEARLKDLTSETGRAASEWSKMRGSFTLDQLSIEQLKQEQKYLQNLQATLRQTDPALQKVEKDLLDVTRALEEASSATALQDRQWERMRQSVRLTDMSLEQLEAETRRLKKELATLNPNTAQFGPLRNQLQAVERQMTVVRTGLGPFGQAWQNVKGQVMGAGAVLGSVFAGGAIIQGMRNLVTGAGKVSDELANIQKSTGLSAAGVKSLNTELGRIDTRTATTDLREIAVGLGQAGQAATKDAVAAIDTINVALGDEFGESSKDIANTLTVLRNGFKDVASGDYGTDVLRIGNALNVLGQEGLATAPIVSDIAKRVAGSATQYKIASGDVLGLAATFQELGINVERGSTAYIRVLNKIAGEPQKFARIVKAAGLDVNLFNEQVNTDLQAAFVTAARAAKIAGASNSDFAAILGELGTEGVGVSELLSKVGENSEMLAAKSKLAGDALQNTASITEEFSLKNNTLQAQLDKLGKELARVFSSSTVQEGLKSIVSGLRDAIRWVKENSTVFVSFGKILLQVGITWGTYKLAILAASAATRAVTALQASQSVVMGLLTGRIGAATVATRIFNTVSKLNPIGAVVAVLTTAVTAFGLFGTKVRAAARDLSVLSGEEQDAARRAQSLYFQILATNEGTEKRVKLINELKAVYPDLLGNLNAETATNAQLATSMEAVNRALINKIVLTRQEEANAALREDAADALSEAQEKEADAFELLSAAAKRYGVDVAAASKGATNAYEQATQVRAAIIKQLQAGGGKGFFPELVDVDNAITELGAYKGLYKQKEQIALQGEQELQRMRDRFGVGAGPTPSDNKSLEEYRKELELIEKRFQEIRAGITGKETPEQDSAIEKEVIALRDRKAKINAIIKDLEKNDPGASVDPFAPTEATKDQTKEKLVEHLNDLTAEMQKWRAELATDTLSEDEKELAALDARHAEELAKVKKQQEELLKAKMIQPDVIKSDLTALDDKQAKERANLIEQQGERRFQAAKEANDRIEKMLDEGRNAHLKAEADALQEELDQFTGSKAEYEALVARHRDALLRLYKANALDALEEETKKWDKVIEEAKERLAEYDAALVDSSADPSAEQLAERKALNDQILALEAAKNQNIEDQNRAHRQREREANKEFTEAERAEAVRRLQNFTRASSDIGAVIDAIVQYQDAGIQAAETRADQDGVRTDEEIANINRLKVARRNAAMASIAVQMATAVATGVASAIASPIIFPGNLLAAAGSIATVIGLFAQANALLSDGTATVSNSAVQGEVTLGAKGLAASGPNVITSAEGGGVLPGQLHTNGGNTVYDNATGKPIAEVEKDELMLVMSRKATEANADLIPGLLDASRKGERIELPPAEAAAPTTLPTGEGRGGVPPEGSQRMSKGRPVRGTAVVNAAAPTDAGDIYDLDLPRMALGGRAARGTAVVNASAPTDASDIYNLDLPRMALGGLITRGTGGPLATAASLGTDLRVAADPLRVPSPATVNRAMRIVHMAEGGLLGAAEEARLALRGPGATDAREGNAAAMSTERIEALLTQLIASTKETTRAALAPKPAELKLGTTYERTLAEYNALKYRNTAQRRRA